MTEPQDAATRPPTIRTRVRAQAAGRPTAGTGIRWVTCLTDGTLWIEEQVGYGVRAEMLPVCGAGTVDALREATLQPGVTDVLPGPGERRRVTVAWDGQTAMFTNHVDGHRVATVELARLSTD